MSAFDIDPSEFWRQHYEKQMLRHLAAIMKAAGLNQIDVPMDSMVRASDTLDICEHYEGRFYRIRGTFEVAPIRGTKANG